METRLGLQLLAKALTNQARVGLFWRVQIAPHSICKIDNIDIQVGSQPSGVLEQTRKMGTHSPREQGERQEGFEGFLATVLC